MIVPTVFTTAADAFVARLQKVLPLTNRIHIDFMDGIFVPKTSPAVEDLPDMLQYNKHFEAHLMVQDPLPWLPKLKEKGFASVAFHVEPLTDEQVFSTIQACKELDLEPTPTKNAQTPLERLLVHLDEVDSVLLMGIEAGSENQPFQEHVYQQVQRVKKQKPAITIEIDGGVSEKTVVKLAHAGATILCSGSYINKSQDPQAAYNTLMQLYKQGETT